MTAPVSAFFDAAASHGLTLDSAALERFSRYAKLLAAKNAVMNLTSVDDPEGIYLRHFADSLALFRLLPSAPFSAIDVGSGGGFPGLPLKIVRPDMRLTLLDATGKKVDFLREVADALGLEGVDCVCARAEEAARSPLREAFDFAFSRGVARLNILCELCLPFVKPGGRFYALKSLRGGEELAEAKAGIKILGGGACASESYRAWPEGPDSLIISIAKAAPTPPGYPRPYAKISKKPL
jgi:16S rRNA (guanine527-N7)-methyltransferase